MANLMRSNSWPEFAVVQDQFKWFFFLSMFCSYVLIQRLHAMLSHFSRVRLCDPIDGSPPGFPIPGILQARTLEWVAISFSNAWKWKEKVKSLSGVRLLATPWTSAYQAPLSMGFSRQKYWSGVPLPSPKLEITNLNFLFLFCGTIFCPGVF